MDIHFENGTYKAILTPITMWTENGLHMGRMLQVFNKKNLITGCLGVYFSRTTLIVWGKVIGKEITEDFLQNIILAIIPRIKFDISLEQVEKLYPKCLSLFISDRETGYAEKENTIYLHNGNSPEEFIHQIVFGGDVTDAKIQKEVLDITYHRWQGKTTIPPTSIDISKYLFLDHQTLLRNINFLIHEKYLDYTKVQVEHYLDLKLTIAHEGIKYVQRNYKAVDQTQFSINVMGDIAARDINKISNSGDNATNIINTGKMTIDNAFNELREAVDKEYTEADKEIIQQQVDALQKEAKENANKESVIKKILGFAQKFVMHPVILNIIISKIIPLLQEAAKHLPQI